MARPMPEPAPVTMTVRCSIMFANVQPFTVNGKRLLSMADITVVDAAEREIDGDFAGNTFLHERKQQ